MLALGALAQPGLHERTLAVDGETVRYTVQIPKGKGPHPLVLVLHYGGPVTPFIGKGMLTTLAGPALADLDAVLIAPDCPGRGWTDPVSVAAALAVVDAVSAEVAVDPARTLVTGFSMGGVGTWHFALTHPERFRVAAPVAGHPPGDLSRLAVPVAIVHGAKDEVMPIGPTAAAVTALRERGHAVKFARLPDHTHYQVAAYAPALKAMVPWIRERWAP